MTVDKPPLMERTLPWLLAHRAEQFPDRQLFDDERGIVTASEAWTSAGQLAGGLHRLGIRHGDRVGLMLNNSREFLQAWFGVSILGAVQVPINPQATGNQLPHVLRHSGARALIVESEVLEQIMAPLANVPDLTIVVVLGEHKPVGQKTVLSFAELVDSPARFDDGHQVTAADTTAIMYTSGSTGPPKGVVLPHGQHFENGWQAKTAAEIQPTDNIFICLPLHHNMAQGYGALPALVSGASFTLARTFTRATFWDELRRSNSTVWPFIGAMLVLLSKDSVSETSAEASRRPVTANPLRVAYGVPIPTELHRRFEETFQLRLVPCYGSTEATIVAWGSVAGGEPVGSCGRILPDFEVQIQAAEGSRVPTGDIGEICIRPREPSIMFQGYHNEPERGRLAMRNLWFHSADRGRIDGDGYLWFEGRREDVVRRFNEFISAHDVEEAILSCPSIDNVAAFAVPDEVAGEELMVAVMPRTATPVTAAEVRDWCRRTLPAFSVPRYVDIVDELPITATGKVEKYVLRRNGVSATTFDARQTQELMN